MNQTPQCKLLDLEKRVGWLEHKVRLLDSSRQTTNSGQPFPWRDLVFFNDLSIRAIKVVYRSGLSPKTLNERELRDVKNCGEYTITEIKKWHVQEFGRELPAYRSSI